MRLLVISGEFPPIRTGDAHHAFHLAQRLAHRGHDVQVLTTPIDGLNTDPSFTVHPLMGKWSWRTAPRLASFVKRCAPDGILLLFVASMYDYHPMMTFAPTIAKSAIPGVPFVTQFEYPGGSRLSLRSFASRLIRKGVSVWAGREGASYAYGTLLRDSDQIIVLSEAHAVELRKASETAGSRIHLIPPPPIMRFSSEDVERARARGRARLRLGENDFLLVFFGYVYNRKGLDTLFHALKSLRDRLPALRLAIVGGQAAHQFCTTKTERHKDYTERMKQLANDLGLADRVIWTGHCDSQSELGSIYLRAADACVLPFDDGVHLNNSSFGAAASHGLPIVTTKSDNTEDCFVDQVNALLCPPRDSRALADAIVTLVEQSATRERLRVGALQMAEEWFSWKRAMDRTLALFGSVVHERTAETLQPADDGYMTETPVSMRTEKK
jgi:glycosyltransferase involved in cell wall biosynthesis